MSFEGEPGPSEPNKNQQLVPAPHVVIRNCEYVAELAYVGGGLKALTYQGKPLIETYPDGELPPLSAGVVLAPWPNRTEDGTFAYHGEEMKLEINEPERNNAIHGLVATKKWQLKQASETAAELQITVAPSSGWPWGFTIVAAYELDQDGLHCRYTATADTSATADTTRTADSTPGTSTTAEKATATTDNSAPMPYAFGLHTYLSALGESVDNAVLSAEVDGHLPLDERKLPEAELKEPELNLAQLPMRGVLLDDCFHANGHTVTLTAQGRGVEMRCSDNLSWYQIFTPDPSWGEPYPGRGRSVAVEPMSVPPNALNSGTGLATLDQPIVHEVHLRVLFQPSAEN